MHPHCSPKRRAVATTFFVSFLAFAGGLCGRAQTVFVVDTFDPAGVGGNSYSGGQIGNIWGNWFGSAFQSLAWDAASDAATNPGSGSMKISANFDGQGSIPNQFEVYDGFNGISPPLNGLLYTNFQCDVRFAPGSATLNNTFGHLEFGIAVGYSQDYFGSVDVPSNNTNWVHVSIPLNALADTNLQNIADVLIHIYGPSMSGVTTLWVDNIRFLGQNPAATNCVVDWNDVHQRIDGFGASSAWNSAMSAAQADLLFSTNNGIVYTDNLGQRSTNNGIGLSLLRTRIAPGGTSVETNIMKLAVARGASVWSSPWSPDVQFKSNGNVNGGGFLGTPANDQAYASQLAGYAARMKSQSGVSLVALSIQNEPDANVTNYESCNWSAQQIHDFVPYLYAALAASNVGSTKIMLPESQNWQDYSNLAVTAMNDPNVAAQVGIIADHNYDGANGPANVTKNRYGKALWETEVSLLSGSDSSIANGVYYAQRIHLFMTKAEVNAWHYWWLVAYGAGNEGLLDNNAALTKRLFAVGNYSRFVRPGFYRIGVSNNALTSVSAYKDPVVGGFAIVAVNSASTTVTQRFDLANFTAGSVMPWITSGSLSLAAQPTVAVNGSTFSYPLPAVSVVTFIGQASLVPTNRAPVWVPVADRTVNAGVTVLVTNMASDPDEPPQALAFSLLTAPPGASLTPLNQTNTLFAWRPPVSSASTTNPVAIVVADNGQPSLSATNRFTVIVNSLSAPSLSAIALNAQGVSVLADGPAGPDYTLLTSTNLLDWQTVQILLSPTLPAILQDTNHSGDSRRFYRVQLGP
jgi:glucuronoarabinoxylan endo-1,4-beta-xylanase